LKVKRLFEAFHTPFVGTAKKARASKLDKYLELPTELDVIEDTSERNQTVLDDDEPGPADD